MFMRRITALHTPVWKQPKLAFRLLRLVCCVGMVLMLLGVGAAAQTPSAEDKDDDEFGRLAKIFRCPGDPSSKANRGSRSI